MADETDTSTETGDSGSTGTGNTGTATGCVPYYQPKGSISKQPGLTVTTSYVRGDYDILKSYIERAKVGLPPPVDTGWTADFGPGNVTTCHLAQESGGLGTLAISVAGKDNTETWLLEWMENAKDIRTWKPKEGEAPNLPQLRFWEALATTNQAAYDTYVYNTQTGAKLTGSTLLLAKMIREEGIESYLAYAPVITKISTLTALDATFSSNVGKIETPTSAATEDEVLGALDVTKFTALANQWLKTVDRIQTALDGTIQRTESWTGADLWNSNLYASA